MSLGTRFDMVAPVFTPALVPKSPTAYFPRAVTRVPRYLRGTSEYGLTYKSGNMSLQAYVDGYCAADTLDRPSISGYLIKLGNLICI